MSRGAMDTKSRNGNRSSGKLLALPVYAQLAFGMAIFGSATPVSKLVTAAMPVFVGSALRVALGALVLAPVALRHRDQMKSLTRRDWLLIGLISVFGMFGFSALMLYGMRMIPGVVGAVVMSTAPAVTAAASLLFLNDRASWRKLAAIALAMTGVLILNFRSGGAPGSGTQMGDLIMGTAMIFAAVCCETAYTLIGKKASERIDPILVAFLAAALAVPCFLPFAIWQWGDFSFEETGWRVWSAVAWYGAGTLAIGTWLWYSGVARAEGTVAAGFMGVMPASALILSYILLDEDIRWIHLAGFLVVFAGVMLISWEHARMSRNEAGNKETR